MNEPLETRLREHLSSVDRAPVADVVAVSAASDRVGQRLRRRRRAALAIASVGLVAIAGVVIWSSQPAEEDAVSEVTEASATSTGDELGATGSTGGASTASTAATVSTVSTAPPAASAWAAIAPDPRGPAWFPSAVWTGSEALVVGGLDVDGEPVHGAAAYDLATDSWRVLAAPLLSSSRIDPLVVWTGAEMLVIGGDNPDGSLLVSAGEAYDPAADTWRLIASPPVGFVSDRSPAVWTGDELLVWPWDGGGSTMVITPIAYDPTSDTWRQLAEPPVERRQRAASVWTGTEWIVWGGTAGDRELADGAAYDPRIDNWRVIADAPLSPRRVRAVWTGTEMIVSAGSTGGDRVTGNGEMALSDGAAYDPLTDSWREISSGLAHPGFVPVWTGSQVIMFAKGGAVVYDVESDRWIDTCCSDTGGGRGGGGGTPVWTGTVVLLLGSGDAEAGGATFAPPVPEPAG
ncbi:MAG: Kelch repeat-containing protein [Acidimicrobiia bacterium]